MFRESESFKIYSKDLSKIPLINKDEQLELAKKAQSGDIKSMEKLTEANLRFVVSIAKEYTNSGIPIDDLVNEGNIGLIKAIYKFDVTKEYKLISYAVWWIRQGIIQSIYETAETIRLPINRISDRNKLLKAKEILYNELNREPTEEELSSFTDISLKDVQSFIRNTGLKIDIESKQSVDGEETALLTEILEGDGLEYLEKKVNKSDVATEIGFSLDALSDREAEIIRLYFGLDGRFGEMRLGEIGEKLNLTNERVRQIKSSALKKLRAHGNSSRLREFLEYNF